MNKEEDGGFSLVVLALAVVLYIAVLSMTFAGMIATRPTVGAAFLKFTKDYGSLLAGIPVLIAVLVAKQQLDATRRQHVATVKRSFKDELDLLNGLKGMCKNHDRRDVQSFLNTATLLNENYDRFKKRESQWEKKAEGILPVGLLDKVESLRVQIWNFNQPFDNLPPSNDILEDRKTMLIREMIEFEKSVDHYIDQLSQYWS